MKASVKPRDLADAIQFGLESDIWYDPRLYAPAFSGEQEGYEKKIEEAQSAMQAAVEILKSKRKFERATDEELVAIADGLDAGVGDDIWYAASDFGDDEAEESIEGVQWAMGAAAKMLRKAAGG